jgi:hypothetical protein
MDANQFFKSERKLAFHWFLFWHCSSSRLSITSSCHARAEGEEMTEQEELIQDIRERLGEMPKRELPFNLLAFTITIGQRYSMTEDKIMPLVMNEADALGVNYRIG